MPALFARKDGKAEASYTTDAFTVGQVRGKAVIIHGAPDNLAHIPSRYAVGGVPGPDEATRATGDAGDRVACGVLR